MYKRQAFNVENITKRSVNSSTKNSTNVLPRNKQQSNKKSKARRDASKAKKEQKAEQLKRDIEQAKKSSSKGGGNQVPKSNDMMGGEAGKTFTTTSHVKVPVWYAEHRDRTGKKDM